MSQARIPGSSRRSALLVSLLCLALCSCAERGAGPKTPSPQDAAEEVQPLPTPTPTPTEPEAAPATPAEPGAAGDVADGDRRALVEGNNRFAFDLYQTLAKAAPGKNLFFSPFSISSALAMTYGGARNKTAKQMAKALHFELEQASLHPAFKAVSAPLQAEQAKKGYQLSVANALWGQSGLPFEQAFLKSSQDNYGAGLRQIDFAKPKAAAKTINDWVEEQTREKIKNLVKPPMVAGAKLVLTNAIYFKGDWQSQFKPARTKAAPFHVKPKKAVETSFMYQQGEFGLAETPELQLLELPYVGEELSMLIFLPRKAGGLAAMEKRLGGEMATLLGQLRKRDVRVHLPKFKLETEYELKKALEKLGMVDAFGGRADFSGMCKSKLGISAVVHKAFVEVNEEGTEAAAATAVIVSLESAAPPATFTADRPFLFVIEHGQTGEPLFVGQVTDPTQS